MDTRSLPFDHPRESRSLTPSTTSITPAREPADSTASASRRRSLGTVTSIRIGRPFHPGSGRSMWNGMPEYDSSVETLRSFSSVFL